MSRVRLYALARAQQQTHVAIHHSVDVANHYQAAHVFHNCKRRTIDLPHTRRKEWLLDIDFVKRETFAYSCEVYSRVLEAGKTPSQRRALADEFAADPWSITERGLDMAEVADLVVAASRARNGWKVILRACAPPRRRRQPAAVRT